LPSVPATLQTAAAQNGFSLTWNANLGRVYQIEYSPDLQTWFYSPTGEVTATNTTLAWLDTGPPGTVSPPWNGAQRYYRVLKYGPP